MDTRELLLTYNAHVFVCFLPLTHMMLTYVFVFSPLTHRLEWCWWPHGTCLVCLCVCVCVREREREIMWLDDYVSLLQLLLEDPPPQTNKTSLKCVPTIKYI